MNQLIARDGGQLMLYEAAARVDLAAAFRWAAQMGFHEAVSNHFSLALTDDGTEFLIQPRGRHFSRVRASELLRVDCDGHVLAGDSQPDPTAAALHGSMHRHVPHARCILHTHMPYATALTCVSGAELEPVSQTALKFYERVAYDRDFGGMALGDDEGKRLARALEDKSVLFMGNHGVTVVGNSVVDAVDKLYFLEKACESQVLAASTGRPLEWVDHQTALHTRDQWESYPDLARNHFLEIKNMLDEVDASYRD